MCIFCEPSDGEPAAGLMTDAEALFADRCAALDLEDRIPVTIVTGFLGAGKTTLLNRILRGGQGKRYAVLQNEFGSVAVDDALTVRSATFAAVEVLTLPSGCLCCTVRGDLVQGLRDLAATSASGAAATGGKHLDAVVVECSGLAQVAPVAQTFFADKFVLRYFKLDCVVALFDALAGPPLLRLAERNRNDDDESDDENDDGDLRDEAAELLAEQLCLADVILVNKLDLVEEAAAAAEAVMAAVVGVNPTARVLGCTRADVDLAEVIDVGSFRVTRALSQRRRRRTKPEDEAPFGFLAAPHAHARFGSVGLESAALLDELRFHDWLEATVVKHASKLLRAKGLVFFAGCPQATAVHCVGAHVEADRLDPEELDPAVLGERRSKLVFIGNTRSPDLRASLEAGFAQTSLGGTP